MKFFRRLRALFRQGKLDIEMADELRAHVELQAAENERRGMSSAEARYAAQRSFGGVEQIKERARDQRTFTWLEHAGRDLRYAGRQLAKSPGFTAIAVLSLALGIGANTAIFSLVDEVLLKSLPVKEPGELVLLSWRATPIPETEEAKTEFTNGLWGGWTDADGKTASFAFSLLAFDRFRERSRTLAEVFGFFADTEFNVIVDGQAEMSKTAQYVTGNYHVALGVPALLGRTLGPDDDRVGAEPVVVISHGYWQRRFGGASSVLGRTITVNKAPFTIVGVTPPDFLGTLEVGTVPDLSLPLTQYPERDQLDRARNRWWLRLMGRLKPGAGREQASAELAELFRDSVQEGISTMTGFHQRMPERYLPQLRVESGAQGLNRMRPSYVRSLATLMGLAGLVLLLACANVANLLLARGAARRREIAVRLALGAGRGRIVRQLLVESGLLTVLGGALGLLLAWWGKDVLVAMHPLGGGEAAEFDARIDPRVLAFTLVVAAGTCALAGLMPALRATRLNLTTEFYGGTRLAGSPAVVRLRRGLMVGQVGLSVILLVAAGLFGRTLSELQRADIGFRRDALLLFRVDATSAGYQPGQFPALHRRLRESMAALPRVRSVVVSAFALFDETNHRPFWVPGQPLPKSEDWASLNAVGEGYFATLGIPVVRGREFGPRDDERASQVAIINQSLARKYFGDTDPIGRRFSIDRSRPEAKIEVIGVVSDTKWTDVREATPPTMYFPFTTDHLRAFSMKWGQMNFVVRGAGESADLVAALRQTVRGVDPTLPIAEVRMLHEQVARLFTRERLFARLASFFGFIALVLASVGLYGLTSYLVHSRTGEIGLRLALGALPGRIRQMIVREALGLVGLGVIGGLAVAGAVMRLVARMLYGISAADPLTYAAVGLLLTAVALLACWLPARRAAKVDPMVALRCE